MYIRYQGQNLSNWRTLWKRRQTVCLLFFLSSPILCSLSHFDPMIISEWFGESCDGFVSRKMSPFVTSAKRFRKSIERSPLSDLSRWPYVARASHSCIYRGVRGNEMGLNMHRQLAALLPKMFAPSESLRRCLKCQAIKVPSSFLKKGTLFLMAQQHKDTWARRGPGGNMIWSGPLTVISLATMLVSLNPIILFYSHGHG